MSGIARRTGPGNTTIAAVLAKDAGQAAASTQDPFVVAAALADPVENKFLRARATNELAVDSADSFVLRIPERKIGSDRAPIAVVFCHAAAFDRINWSRPNV